jgi:hypothetical protein
MTASTQRRPLVGDRERRLLALLIDGGATRPGGVIVPQPVLATACGIGLRQLQRRIRRLREARLLDVEGRRGRRRPNRYRVGPTSEASR